MAGKDKITTRALELALGLMKDKGKAHRP
jgi:hypothetical protein